MKHLLIILLTLSVVLSAFADEATFDPVADSPVFELHSSNNYGSQTYGYWGYFNGRQRTLIAYDLTSLSAVTVTSAKITFSLYSNISGTGKMQARKLLDTWSEFVVTWGNQPNHDTTSDGLMLDQDWVTDLGPFTQDLTAEAIPIIQDWVDTPANNYGFILLKEPESGEVPRCYPYMKENGTGFVKLTIGYDASPGIKATSLGSIRAAFK